MYELVCQVGMIFLVPSQNFTDTLFRQRVRYPFLPVSTDEILLQIQELNMYGGIPAVFEEARNGDSRIVLFTDAYALSLFPTERGGGYRITYIEPLRWRHLRCLRQGYLRMCAYGWRAVLEPREIPPNSNNHWQDLEGSWERLEGFQRQHRKVQMQHEARERAYENYLQTLSSLIELTRELEQDKARREKSVSYTKVDPVGEKNYDASDTYIFHLASRTQIDENEYVQIREAPDLQGRVRDLDGQRMKVQFFDAIDFARIRRQGTLDPMPNQTVFKKQRLAVRTLQDGNMSNKQLLPILVDREYQSYYSVPISPSEPLNIQQLKAFRRALAVPDLLLVLGPPGTGKTRTITEIAKACSEKHLRILITSKTHKAVDNVLRNLSPDLTVLRFGIADRVASDIHPRLISVQAREMQKTILDRTETLARRLESLLNQKVQIERGLQQLRTIHDQLASLEKKLNMLKQQVYELGQQIDGPFHPRLALLANQLQRYSTLCDHIQQKIQRLSVRRTIWEQQQQQRHYSIKWLFALLIIFWTFRLGRSQEALLKGEQLYKEADGKNQQVKKERADAFNVHADYQHRQRQMTECMRELTTTGRQALPLVALLQKQAIGLIPEQPVSEPHLKEGLWQFLSAFGRQFYHLTRRAYLLKEWRNELLLRTEQLYPELVNYADVVGATCIGAATAEELESVEFDLVVVDEAGQICLPDLLVPLVRAKRAVLVGDHQQLPPFLDSEVKNWLDTLSPQRQRQLDLEEEDEEDLRGSWARELLTKSTFELLFTDRPDQEHIVPLREQWRTPTVVANFVAKHFYDRQLTTSERKQQEEASFQDSLFKRPLVFVDTAALPLHQKRDRSPEAEKDNPEGWGKPGYRNPVEAKLLASLVTFYEREGRKWVVIVPYLEQARLLRSLLRTHLKDGSIEFDNRELDEKVATVDSFQGGQADTVFYSFTRSNNRGCIGFLNELRRLNVAMTRTERLLVLIGDSATLTHSTDEKFNILLNDLKQHIKQQGEWLSHEACYQRLRSIQS